MSQNASSEKRTVSSSPDDSVSRSVRLPAERWVRLVFGATLITVFADAFYVYVIRLHQLVHSDAACLVLMTKSALDARLPVSPHWYWANGDVWLFGTAVAGIPVALAGIGLGTLRAVDVFGFLLEFGVLTFCFRTLTRRTWLSLFAAGATLLEISRLHFLFVYVELSYGFIAMTYVAVFALFASALPFAEDESPPTAASRALRRRWIAGAAWLFVVALSNPTRFLVFGLAPILAACLWPWRGVPARARATLAGVAVGSWGLALGVYRAVFERYLTFTPHAGNNNFAFRDLAGIADNLTMLGRGLIALSGDPGGFTLAAVPGLLLLLGGVAFVVARVLTSRSLTRERFMGVLVLAELGAVLTPVLLGNLLLDPLSTRYIMPAALPLMGLGVVAAYGYTKERGWPAVAARAWLCLLPVMGLLAFVRMIGASLEAAQSQWSNRSAHATLAKELARRHLRHGFATYWNSNLVTMLSSGATSTCGVFVADNGFVPQKWNVDAACFDPSRLPPEVYVVASHEEREVVRRALESAFPEPRERFTVADEFEVAVFETAKVPTDWLTLPLPSGKNIHFPVRLAASYIAIRRTNAELTPAGVVATGEAGNVVYGPYIDMLKGKYRVVWTGSGVDSPGEIIFDAYAHGAGDLGRDHVVASTLTSRKHSALTTIHVELTRDTRGVEFRVYSAGGGKVALDELQIDKE